MAIRAKADITISRIIDIQSVTRYYLLQSSTSASPNKPSTNPPASSWTKTEPSYTSGSTNTLYFVDCTEFTNDTFSYSEVSKSSSYEAAKVAYNKAANVKSRINTAETQIEQNTTEIALRATKTEVNALIEGNLIVNGFGLNRDNYNFDQWTYDGTDKCDGYPSFKFAGVPKELRIPCYMIPIDISKTYEFKMDFKGDSSKRLYLGWDEFDIDGNYISPTYCTGFPASTTTLAQDLKNGDTVVHLTSAAGWSSTSYTHQLGLIFWNYKDSTGYQYPVGVYSRYAWLNLYTYDNVDKTNNTITLTSAWNYGTFLAGTEVSQSNSGGHKYFNYANTYYPSEWTETSWIIGGVQTLYGHQYEKFNQAAKYIRFIILHNYGGGSTSATVSISKISLCDATLKKNLTDNYYNKTQTDAMIKVESDRITSAVTRIGTNESSLNALSSATNTLTTRVDVTESGVAKAQSDIDSLEVGGRNLLLGTSNSAQNISIGQWYNILGSRAISELGLVDGDSVTMSVWYHVPETNTKSVGLRFQTWVSASDRDGRTSTEFVQPGETKRLSYTYTMTDALLARDTFQVLIQSGNTSEDLTETVEYWGLKLEKGNKATDWTPAPEDMATAQDANRAQTAADNAQTAANNAQADIDGLEIGGRNYYKQDQPWMQILPSTDSDGLTHDVIFTRPHDDCPYGFCITGGKGNNGSLRIRNVITDNGYWTVSFWVRGSQSTAISLWVDICDQAAQTVTTTNDNTWKKIEITYLVNNYTESTYNFVDFSHIQWAYFYIKNFKVEKGNRATDWVLAPEDMATAEDAERAQETANSAQETAVEAESLIKQLADNISMLVTDGNGTSLMAQTEDGWVFSTADLQKTVNATSEGLDTLVNNLSDINSAIGVLQQAVDDLGVLSDYITIGTYEDQPCIELGETDSEFKLRITNTQVVYTEGSTVLAYFTNQSMHIKKAVIEEELQQGGFVWKVRSNGNMGLVWKGVSS